MFPELGEACAMWSGLAWEGGWGRGLTQENRRKNVGEVPVWAPVRPPDGAGGSSGYWNANRPVLSTQGKRRYNVVPVGGNSGEKWLSPPQRERRLVKSKHKLEPLSLCLLFLAQSCNTCDTPVALSQHISWNAAFSTKIHICGPRLKLRSQDVTQKCGWKFFFSPCLVLCSWFRFYQIINIWWQNCQDLFDVFVAKVSREWKPSQMLTKQKTKKVKI